MPARKLLLLVVALMIGIGTVILSKSMMTGTANNGAQVKSAPVADEILTASKDLPSGTLLKEVDLKWTPWPVSNIDPAIFAVKGKANMSDYVGAVVRQGLRAGEPIMAGRVVRARDQGFMAAVLNPGMRAVSVPVTPAGVVAGFVFPGDRVDVIVTHQIMRKIDPDPNGHKVSETILTNVRVLALDQRTSDQLTEPKIAQTATLEVTPKQAEALALITQIGTLSLALRSMAASPDEPPGINAQALESAGIVEAQGGNNELNMTWDSDVSSVLSKPANRRGVVQRIQIMRGKDATESIFELRQ